MLKSKAFFFWSNQYGKEDNPLLHNCTAKFMQHKYLVMGVTSIQQWLVYHGHNLDK
jgi:hypothetical protein